MQKTGIAEKQSWRGDKEFNSKDSKGAGEQKPSALPSLLCNPLFSIAVITLICAISYGRTLGSFFLADDIGEVRYVHQIFEGRWDLFWSNFCGNYMQVPNMSVYRPMLLITLVMDFLVWKGNAFGYYLSNLFYYTGTACLLAMFLRQLCSGWGRAAASAVGLASAIIFACNPLHCESISWVVGRVDSACCMFYLAALCIFMRRAAHVKRERTHLLTALGLLFFTLAICVKEMAIGLAPVLAGIAFFFPESCSKANETGKEESYSLRARLKLAWQNSRAVWIATAVYFVIRLLSLGTLLGGYNGGIGATQSASAVTRWLDIDNWRRLFMPLPYEIYGSNNHMEHTLLAVYAALGFFVFLRLLTNSIPWRTLLFLGFWAATLAAPIYRLFGIGANLEGGRFCFFLTLAISCVFPVLLFAPENSLPKLISKKLQVCGVVMLALLACTLQRAAYSTNLLWLHAGREVKAVLDDALKLSKTAKPGEKILLLGVPKQHAGAHMILNGPTLDMLLAPPFAKKEAWEPLLTFDSILFGDENLIDSARLRLLANKPGYRGPFVWEHATKHFVELKQSVPQQEPKVLNFALSAASNQVNNAAAPYVLGHGEYEYANGGLNIRGPKDNDGLRLSRLQVNPLAYSHLKVSFTSSNNKIDLPFQVRWKASANGESLRGESELNFLQKKILADNNAGPNTVRTIYIPLGRQWRWYAQNRISDLTLYLPAVQNISIKELALLSAEKAAPTIGFGTDTGNNCGVINYTNQVLNLHSDQGDQINVQVSKKEFFFDNLDEKQSAAGIAAQYTTKPGGFKIPQKSFEGAGYYQIRAQALDGNGKAIADYSDPLTISLGR